MNVDVNDKKLKPKIKQIKKLASKKLKYLVQFKFI